MLTNNSRKGQRAILLLLALLFPFVAFAQNDSVSGTVRDESGEPIIGAFVLVKGTNNGTSTGLDGEFTLRGVKRGDVLQASCIGYLSEETSWNGSSNLVIVLSEESEMLEEAVALGYGIKQTRGLLTNSIAKVGSETLATGSYGDPAQALVGAVAGVRVEQTSGFPGTTPDIIIRGGTAFDGTGSPIVVVDGQIRQGGLSDINPGDIESIEILKDAGATALYGARASNGVVLVTTKGGSPGKATITLDLKMGMQTYVAPYEFLDAEDYLYWIRTAYYTTSWAPQSNLTSSSTPFGIGRTSLDSSTIYNVMKWTGSEEQQNLLDNHGWKIMDDPVSDEQILFKNTDVKDYLINTPVFSQDYTVSVSGGNDRGTYYASIGYYDTDGLTIGTFYTRYSFSFNASYKITKWLDSKSTFTYNMAKYVSTSPKGRSDAAIYAREMSMPPTVRFEDEEGNYLLGISVNDGNYRYEIDKYHKDNQKEKFNINETLTATLFPGFQIKGTVAWQYNEVYNESFTQDYHTNQAETSLNTTRSSSNTFYRYFNQTYNVVASYDKTFGSHHVNASVGTEFYRKTYKYMYAQGQGAPTDDFQDLAYTSTEEGYRDVDSSHTEQRIMSYFGRVQYDYDGKYILAFTFREDGYSALLNNRWGFFPGVSAGWVFSKEDFFANVKPIVNYGKLRASYGLNGDASGIGAYTLQGKYSSYTYNGEIGYRISTLANASLKWEKTRTGEFGIDAGFLDNRFTFSFTFYDRLTSDKYADLTLPTTTGYSSVDTNNGEFRNRGIEFEFNANLLTIRDFRWVLNGNIAYNKNTVVSLPYNGLENNRQGGTEVYTGNGDETHYIGGLQEGKTPYDVIVGYQCVGMVRTPSQLPDGYCDVSQSYAVYYGDKGYAKLQEYGWSGTAYELECGNLIYKDINGDGIIDTYDRTDLGNYTPKWQGGFNTTFSWRGWSLYARFTYGLGFYSYEDFNGWSNGCKQGVYNATTKILDSWTESNTDGSYPRYYYYDQNGYNNYRISSYWVKKGDYLCFKELQLSYRIPAKITRKVHCENLTLSFTAQNLGYLTNSASPIPDYVHTSSSAGSTGTYNLPRIFLWGAKIVF